MTDIHLAPLSWQPSNYGRTGTYRHLPKRSDQSPFVKGEWITDIQFDKTTHESYEDFYPFWDRGDIKRVFNQKEWAYLYETRATSLDTARYTKILLKHELAISWMKNWRAKGIVSLWSVRLDVRKNWSSIPSETEMAIFVDNPNPLRLSTLTQFWDLPYRLGPNFTTRQAMILKVSTKVRPTNQLLHRKSKSLSTNKPAHQICINEKGDCNLTKGLDEYEIMEPNTIAVTILHCIVRLGSWVTSNTRSTMRVSLIEFAWMPPSLGSSATSPPSCQSLSKHHS